MTLKRLIELHPYKNDIEIISQWFVENNSECEGLKLISRLAQAQVKKVTDKYEFILRGLPYVGLGATENKTYSNLAMLERLALGELNLESFTNLYAWAKEEIPKMIIPNVFYAPTIDYLKKYGIVFKDSYKIKGGI